MKIILKGIGKRYNRDWIFRNVNCEFSPNKAYVILGANGSGKSTLLKLVAGNLQASEGDISYHNPDALPVEEIYSQLSIAAPYLELFEEYTLAESISLHTKFKPLRNGMNTDSMVELMELQSSKNKQLKYFSSGMKQRVRLALAILSDTPLLLLDEPASNLDSNAVNWYQQLIRDHAQQRLIIVCSNKQLHEYEFCTEQIQVEDFK